MRSEAKTVAEYIASLPEDRRDAIKAVRAVVKKHLPAGYKEGMDFGHIGWSVPLSVYADTYTGQPLCYAALASQKNHMALYLMSVYGDTDHRKWFEAAWKKTGKKLDMGKSCIRFKKVDDLPLDVITEAIARTPVDKYVAAYEAARKR
jgi:uncharacterized protein YdhG (YjbR/CyaY superfamily)